MSVKITIELPLASVAAMQAHLDTDDVVLPELDTVSASVRAAVFDAVEALPYRVSTAPPIATKVNTPATPALQPEEKKEPPKKFVVNASTLRGRKHLLQVTAKTKIRMIKEVLHDKGEVVPSDQRLIWKTHTMEDTKTLGDYGVKEDDAIICYPVLRGS